MDDNNGKKDARSNRLGGLKNCECCGKQFDAFRAWDKYCDKKCGAKARAKRFWANKVI